MFTFAVCPLFVSSLFIHVCVYLRFLGLCCDIFVCFGSLGVHGGSSGCPWKCLGGPRGFLVRPWGCFGGSFGVLELFLGSLGGPQGVLGGSWGDPGRSQATFWVPRSDPDDKGAHSGGSRGGYRRVEKSPESIFLRSREAKCVYFQGFEHVHFVDFMWPLAAPGPPGAILGGLGGSRVGLGGAQGGSWEEMIRPQDTPGGSRATGFRPQGAPGGPSMSPISVLER